MRRSRRIESKKLRKKKNEKKEEVEGKKETNLRKIRSWRKKYEGNRKKERKLERRKERKKEKKERKKERPLAVDSLHAINMTLALLATLTHYLT